MIPESSTAQQPEQPRLPSHVEDLLHGLQLRVDALHILDGHWVRAGAEALQGAINAQPQQHLRTLPVRRHVAQ